MSLFHLCPAAAWAAASTHYRTPSLSTEGFIHLSTERQWRQTAARFFRGQQHLVLLELDEAPLAPHVRYERADGDDFPHLYAPLPVSAVVSVTPLFVDDGGAVTLGHA